MQTVTREQLLSKAVSLLSSGTVNRVLGWKKGDFAYDVTPSVFETESELQDSFVYNIFCSANFSKYLISETQKEGRVLVFLKPCDSYSFNQLLTEHRFDRERVYAVGIPCDGMMDTASVKALAPDGLTHAVRDGEQLKISTLYDGETSFPFAKVLPDRCKLCKSKKVVVYDEMLGTNGDITDAPRFEEVVRLENMTEEERYTFWQKELSRCIRCNACRDVCPACTCEKCVFDNPASGVENKAIDDPFEEKLFHIIRAFHVAGRCTDCGECSRVCPQSIPLHLLNRKFIYDIDRNYGEYIAGAEEGLRAPLVDYHTDDPETDAVMEGGQKQ
ncbi:MAG: 4Fe-4S dicluster domain-containing protein [Clostridia bacterium]|nr:4Fe-4S dicluster domain-containing protein [Clostridia bacterium]